MDDRGLDSFCNISAIQPSPGLCWGGGEADLVVGNDMNYSVVGIMV